MRVLVSGAGGFIGHHLCKRLVKDGHWVRGVDIHEPAFEPTSAHEFLQFDLRHAESAYAATDNIEQVYHLAADMGGMGFITTHKTEIMHNSGLMNLLLLRAAQFNRVNRFFFSSSLCVYPRSLQTQVDAPQLKESDAYPADPEDGYGWDKLTMERLCRHYYEEYGLETRLARFENTYGEYGTYTGGREKSPAAICRKVALAKDSIEVWGDGQQTRCYVYIADLIEGICRLMASDEHTPVNLGSNQQVTINQLVDTVAEIAAKTIAKEYQLDKPQGVRGRIADISKAKAVLDWQPTTSLHDGLASTYTWIKAQLDA